MSSDLGRPDPPRRAERVPVIGRLAARFARTLPAPLYRSISETALEIRSKRHSDHSALGEVAVARELFAALGIDRGFVADIAAFDGVTGSNALDLFQEGWRGLAVEADPERFARLARIYTRFETVALARTWVTPGNVCELLAAAGAPQELDFLNLDIDSYDHFVLEAILGKYRPRLICAEINEKIPPPIRFTVRYDSEHAWREDHFFGQSLSQLDDLARRSGYVLVRLHYNNAFLAPADTGLLAVTVEDAYREGYLERPDRLEAFPWNRELEVVHDLPVDEQLAFFEQLFAPYAGSFELHA